MSARAEVKKLIYSQSQINFSIIVQKKDHKSQISAMELKIRNISHEYQDEIREIQRMKYDNTNKIGSSIFSFKNWLALLFFLYTMFPLGIGIVGFVLLFFIDTTLLFQIAMLPIDYYGYTFWFSVVLALSSNLYVENNNNNIRKKIEEFNLRKNELEEELEIKLKKLRIERDILIQEFEAMQRKKGLVKWKNKWGTAEQVNKWKEIDIGLINNFSDYSPYQFEDFVSKLFQKMGYKTKVTNRSGDFGADVLASLDGETLLIEVKKYAMGNNITPQQVQRTLGALWKHKADKAIFLTTSDFTVRAKEIEKESPIELWNYKMLHKMVRKYFLEDGDTSYNVDSTETNTYEDMKEIEESDEHLVEEYFDKEIDETVKKIWSNDKNN